MRVLVFGGSFDPPHKGHADLLKAARKAIRPDRVVVVPAYQAPLKGAPSASARDRLAMARQAFGRKARVDASELRGRRKVYTVDTLARMKGELHFVVGSDSAASFSRWKNPKRLRRLATWWTARRPGSPKPPSFFRLVPGRMPDVSSTEVRSRLALGKPVENLLAPRVAGYIGARGLYGSSLRRELSRSLKPGRFEHTLCVAGLADELAARHGLDRDRARLAGLLHDCGRRVPVPKMADYVRKNRVKVPLFSRIVARNPILLHAYISEDVARRRFRVADPEVLAAVRNHTLGAPRMGPLERLLYVADACSEDRRYPEAKTIRALARKDLEKAFRAVVRQKLRFVEGDGAWVHPMTRRLWNSLKKA